MNRAAVFLLGSAALGGVGYYSWKGADNNMSLVKSNVIQQYLDQHDVTMFSTTVCPCDTFVMI